MGSSYMERAAMLELGRKSPHMERLMRVETPKCTLDEEQYCIMSLVCDKIGHDLDDVELVMFVEAVEMAQSLMPGGSIHSRQIIVSLAMMSGITEE